MPMQAVLVKTRGGDRQCHTQASRVGMASAVGAPSGRLSLAQRATLFAMDALLVACAPPRSRIGGGRGGVSALRGLCGTVSAGAAVSLWCDRIPLCYYSCRTCGRGWMTCPRDS
jgi:hypothetical protein